MLHHGLAQTSLQELLSHSSTSSDGMTLSERTARVLNAMSHVQLRMTGSDGAPLTELLQVIHGEEATKCQTSIEHRTHVARVEEETVTSRPEWISGIINQELREEHVDEIGSTHGTTGMTGLGLLNHRRSQDSDVVGCVVH